MCLNVSHCAPCRIPLERSKVVSAKKDGKGNVKIKIMKNDPVDNSIKGIDHFKVNGI
jgi:hypothetical protein